MTESTMPDHDEQPVKRAPKRKRVTTDEERARNAARARLRRARERGEVPLTPRGLRQSEDPDFVGDAPDQRQAFTVKLGPHEAEWLTRFSAMNGETPERMIETLLRRAKAADPTKGGTRMVGFEGGRFVTRIGG